MMTDHEIRHALDTGAIKIDPYPDIDCIQSCSIDLHLGMEIVRFTWRPDDPIRFRQELVEGEDYTVEKLQEGQDIHLDYGEFILARTREKWYVAPDIAAQLDGKSTTARYGLLIHLTAGFFDPGWNGVGTMEIANLFPRPIILRPGDKVCQLFFTKLAMPVDRPYGSMGLHSHYQNAKGVEVGKTE